MMIFLQTKKKKNDGSYNIIYPSSSSSSSSSSEYRIPRFVDTSYVDCDVARLQRIQYSMLPNGHPMKSMLQQVLDSAPPVIPDYYELTPDNPDRKWMELTGPSTTTSTEGGGEEGVVQQYPMIPWIPKETYIQFAEAIKTELLATDEKGRLEKGVLEENVFRYYFSSNNNNSNSDADGGRYYERRAATVLSFRSSQSKSSPQQQQQQQQQQQLNRIEYWKLKEHDGDAFIVLQTASGKFLLVGVQGGHSKVLCNLLDFTNSDGNTKELETTLIRPIANYLNDPQHFIDDTIQASIKYLYQQDH